jgi:hypothetical protein
VPILRARARRAGVHEHAQRDFKDQPREDSYRVAAGLLQQAAQNPSNLRAACLARVIDN